MSTQDRENARSRFGDVVIAWLPALGLFILNPLAIYLPNQREYDYTLLPLVPFFLAALISFVVLLGLLLIKSRAGSIIAVTLFYLGVFLILSDILAPVPLGLLEDFSELNRVEEPLRLNIIQLLIAVGVILCAIKVPVRVVRDVGPFVVAALAIVEVVVVVASLSSHTRLFVRLPEFEAVPGKEAPANRPNVYQIVFDGYTSCVFAERASDLSERFKGFTFFRENRSNYIYTPLSYTSYMTGTLFDGRSLGDWQEDGLRGGLIEHLYQAGYSISYYPLELRLVHQRASHVRLEKEISWFNTNLMRIWLVRVAPNALRQEFNSVARRLGRMWRDASTRSVKNAHAENDPSNKPASEADCSRLMRLFLQEEARRPSRGQYVYVHINIPHPPFWWDCSCRFVERSTYEGNACCADSLMRLVIKRLQELGKYDESLIIFQSDHGWPIQGRICGDKPKPFIPPEVSETVVRSTNGEMTGEQFVDRTRALFLIKPPGAPEQPLQVSDAPTMLLDLPATICRLAGLEGCAGMGATVFELDPAKPREIHFYSGYKRAGTKKGVLVLGKHLRSTEMGHFSFTNGQGWRVYEPFRADAGGRRFLP
ncbi:MAG: sulfatase-like hydrolase/transferase [Thermodesulfobacteriota bacterium]